MITLVPEWEKLRSEVLKVAGKQTKVLEYIKQLNVETHAITNKTDRPDKTVVVKEGEREVTRIVKVSRLVLPMQKKIVGLAASFLCGNPVTLQSNPSDDLEKEMLKVLTRTWKRGKLDYDTKEMCNILFSETEVAELWYRVDADKLYWKGTANEGRPHRLRMKILSNSNGDSLYPIFNNLGDMIAFARGYSVKVEGKDEEHFDVYTDAKIYLSKKGSAGWDVTDEVNHFGKIPVVYYSQPVPDWNDVQSMIDRFEKLISNHADANDRHLFPMIKVTGDIEGAPIPGESGNILKMANGGDASYLEWKQITQSLELELKNLRSLIFDMTDTPDISIEQLKALGTYSGIALKMIFMSAHLKASDKEAVMGKSIQRRINLIISAMTVINNKLENAGALDVSPKFEYYLPKDEEGMINMLVNAVGGKPVMTVASAVRRNPLIENPDEEIEKLAEETKIEEMTPAL